MEPGLQGMEPDHHQVMELGHHQVMEPGHHQGMEPGPQGMGGRTKNQPNVMESGTGREMVTGEEVMVGDVAGEREIACKDGNKIKRLSSWNRRTEKCRSTRRRLEREGHWMSWGETASNRAETCHPSDQC